MQQPAYLEKGSIIHVLSTARKISREELQPAIDLFESWGLTVKQGEHLLEVNDQFAGTENQRTRDLQAALDDDNCKAIVCARGGYGTVQLIDEIDFTGFQQNPKWIVGYSDVTVLHNHINKNLGIETIHSIMPIDLSVGTEADSKESLRKALFGEELVYSFSVEKESVVTEKKITAPLVGGNLSILYSLTGTSSQINGEGKFIFMEDLDEYLYHIDRMLMNLKRAGIFEGCKGVLVGGMNDMNDNAIPYGKTANEIIRENLREYKIPVIFGVPAGHIKQNLALIMGREVELSITGSRAQLKFHGRT